MGEILLELFRNSGRPDDAFKGSDTRLHTMRQSENRLAVEMQLSQVDNDGDRTGLKWRVNIPEHFVIGLCEEYVSEQLASIGYRKSTTSAAMSEMLAELFKDLSAQTQEPTEAPEPLPSRVGLTYTTQTRRPPATRLRGPLEAQIAEHRAVVDPLQSTTPVRTGDTITLSNRGNRVDRLVGIFNDATTNIFRVPRTSSIVNQNRPIITGGDATVSEEGVALPIPQSDGNPASEA